MFENSLEQLRGLQELLVAHQDSIQKPTKANAPRWLECKYSTIKTAFENFELYITRSDGLTQTDSNREKRA